MIVKWVHRKFGADTFSQEYHSMCTSNGFQCVILRYCVELHEDKCCHMRLKTSGKDISYIGLVQRTNSAFVRHWGIRLKGAFSGKCRFLVGSSASNLNKCYS